MDEKELQGQKSIDSNSTLIEEAESLKIKCEEYLNGWKRAKADLINYQKDEIKRFEQILKFGNENLVKDLLVILDSFNLAAESLTKEASSPAYKALFLIQSQLEDLLKKVGFRIIKSWEDENIVVIVKKP